MDATKTYIYEGVVDESVSFLTTDIILKQKKGVFVIVANTIPLLSQWIEEIRTFASMSDDKWECFIFPEMLDEEVGLDEQLFDVHCDRISVVSHLMDLTKNKGDARPVIIAGTPKSLFQKTASVDILTRNVLVLEEGGSYDFNETITRLSVDLGYYSEALCEGPGQFSVRGGLIDVYPVNGEFPVRIDFFGDEVESIKSFDPGSQRTSEKINNVSIFPLVTKFESRVEEGFLHQYLPSGTRWIFRGIEDLEYRSPECFYNYENRPSSSVGFTNAFERKNGSRDQAFVLDLVGRSKLLFSEGKKSEYATETLESFRSFPYSEVGFDRFESEQSERERFLRNLIVWQNEGLQVVIVLNNEGERDRLKEIVSADPTLRSLNPFFVYGYIRSGFRCLFKRRKWVCAGKFDGEKKGVVFVSEGEIFGRYRKRQFKRSRKKRATPIARTDQLLNFTELVDGDHLVHLQYGICIYRGLSKMEFGKSIEEVVSLEFKDEALVHLPLSESHLISRYVGLSKSNPKLGNPGSKNWEKARGEAEVATLDFAAELLRFEANREAVTGFPFPSDSLWQEEFENAFIYKETPDQLNAIRLTKEDMEKSKPMDRLICGDVGFGKTEVAMRAAFKAVMGGKQVAILVPTTVLCQQHYNSFKERMADYPVIIEMMSRFRSPNKQKIIAKEAREGKIDILIGTHRLFSDDVQFKELGLLVVDEEQRFGVKHKEKIKRLKANVDILTLSATPIPRTLYLALSGARGMSVIETPPIDRLPIQTFVKNHDPGIVKKAIQLELSRGGQVFYLHNKVRSIQTVAKKLKLMFPNLKISVGHGQMSERELERVMTEFVAGEADVLVCTTIIESGLDIPNCNTMIIEGADKFGLSQLYQLRGRVGRSKNQAYVYLLLNEQAKLLSVAKKRLASIKQLTQLGAGFRIAMRDLELRGAGNLLGAEQSGHIAGVGFDLYCQLLKQSVAMLSGEELTGNVRAIVRLDFVVNGEPKDSGERGVNTLGYQALKDEERSQKSIESISAYIPEEYMPEPSLRIEFYRKLSFAENLGIVGELKEALVDRFGKLPKPLSVLIHLTEIRCLAELNGVLSVETEGNRLKCRSAKSSDTEYLKIGSRFPRLQKEDPILRLQEVKNYIKRVNN